MSEQAEGDEAGPQLPPVYSIAKEGRLVAYARRAVPEGGGAVQRASGKVPTVLLAITYGVIDCFDARAAKLIAEKAGAVETLDALLFELKLEGFDVYEGETKPHGARWAF